MRRSIFIAMIICLAVLAATAGSVNAQTAAQSSVGPSGAAASSLNNQTENPARLWQQLTEEIKKLRFEMQKLQLEVQRLKVGQLRSDLRQMQTDKRKLAEQETENDQDIAGLDEQLSQPLLSLEERAELETAKAELAKNGPEKLRAEQQRISRQEAEMNHQLEEEQQRLQELAEKVKKLETEAGNSKAGVKKQ